MVLTDSDSLFFTAVHRGVSLSEGAMVDDSTPENDVDCCLEVGFKIKLLIDRHSSEKYSNNQEGTLSSVTVSWWLITRRMRQNDADLSTYSLYLHTLDKLLWDQTDANRPEMIIWLMCHPLCFISSWIECFYIVDCESDRKSILKTSTWAGGIHSLTDVSIN